MDLLLDISGARLLAVGIGLVFFVLLMSMNDGNYSPSSMCVCLTKAIKNLTNIYTNLECFLSICTNSIASYDHAMTHHFLTSLEI